MNKTLFLVGAFTDIQQAEETSRDFDAILLRASSSSTSHLPFAALVIKATDELDDFTDRADAGAYLVCERTIRNQPLAELTPNSKPGCVGIFTMVANEALGAREADRHWRDKHAPLALEVHVAMTHYYQLSILQTLKGPTYTGFALCCFASEDDLRNKFFDTPEGERAVAKDVAYFASPKSPRRVISTISVRNGD